MNEQNSSSLSFATANRPAGNSHSGPVEVGAMLPEANKAEGRRVLIVEDDLSLAGFLSGELEFHGFSVEQVHDGEEALRLLEDKRRFDLLILDLNLPKMDGLSLINHIRPSQPRLPMLVLTARSRVEDKVAAL